MNTKVIRATGGWMLMAMVALGFSMMAGMPRSAAAAEPPPEWDGLLRVPDKGPNHLYLLRGADFAPYTQVRIEPVQVSFDANWQSNANVRSAHRMLSDHDMEQLRAELAREFHMIFANELMREGYMITSASGDHVLNVKPGIVNLYITAPGKPTSGRSRRYIASTGHMTLVLELRDSVSGQLLGRVVDTVDGRRAGGFAIASPVTNLADARAALSNWARMTLTALNYAKQASPGTAVAEKKSENNAKPR